MLQKINRGDVYFYNFGSEFDGSVEGKNRPCVIISNDKGNNFGTTALVAPITTRSKESCKPWQVHYTNGNKSQVILCEQIKTVNISKLYNYQGKLSALTMRAVDEALAIEFDLNVTQREQDSTEFLHRLDIALMKVTNNHLTNYGNKITEIITNALHTTNNYKHGCEQLYNTVAEKVNNDSSNKEVLDGIAEIKSIFNKNAENLDKILTTLINLYKDMKNGQNATFTSAASYLESSSKDNENDNGVRNEVKSSHPRYTVEFAKQFIEDYYRGDRNEFLNKYELQDTVTINNRLTTMKNLLKRNGINWRNIKDDVKVYNVNDMTPEEQISTFGKIIKTNKTNIVNDNADKSNLVPEEYGINDTSNYKSGNGQNRGCKYATRLTSFEYSVENCLAFVEECNTHSIEEMCENHNLTNKQFTNRKYLICKWLKEQGISFKVVKYKRS